MLLGATLEAVRRRRHVLHIAPCAQELEAARERRHEALARARSTRTNVYTPENDALLGTMPDADLARLWGRTTLAVQARRIVLKIPKFDPKLHRWSQEDDALLGTLTDKEVAARLGLTTRAVAHRRLRLGKPVLFAHRRPWTPAEDALLGTASDTEIATRLGRHLAVVCIRRQKLGIPNFCRKQRSGSQRVSEQTGSEEATKQ